MAKEKTQTQKKVRVTRKDIEQVRKSKKAASGPSWTGHEDWDLEQFKKVYYENLAHYRLTSSGKDLKPSVIDWMEKNSFAKEDIAAFRRIKDWRCHSTMGALAIGLMNGMPDVREGFNNDLSNVQTLKRFIRTAIDNGGKDIPELAEEPAAAEKKPAAEPRQPNIQERMREIANEHIGHFDELQDGLRSGRVSAKAYDYLMSKKVSAPVAVMIRAVLQQRLAEWNEAEKGPDEQLQEGYSHWRRADFKKYSDFVQSILTDLDTYLQSTKTVRKARVKKAPSKEKLVARLKFCREFATLKLVSINPADIIGMQQLWVYNVKTRKLGVYEAEDMGGVLGVKGSSITGYKESTSRQKTLRKPEQTLTEFRKANKVQLKKFLDTVKTTETKLTGRISEDVVLLKVQ